MQQQEVEINKLVDIGHKLLKLRGVYLKNNDENRYNNIIDLPNHVSPKRRRMTLSERSAQFAPFASLNGYEDAVTETARVTEDKHELSEEQLETISKKINLIKSMIGKNLFVEIIYFKVDKNKSGGEYRRIAGTVTKILENQQEILIGENNIIKISDIYEIYCDILDVALI